MATKKTVDDPQGQLFDRVIDDEALEAAVARFLDTKTLAKQHAKARKTLYDRLNELPALEDGERIRIGRFVVEGKARAGGGFTVPKWESTGIGAIAELT